MALPSLFWTSFLDLVETLRLWVWFLILLVRKGVGLIAGGRHHCQVLMKMRNQFITSPWRSKNETIHRAFLTRRLEDKLQMANWSLSSQTEQMWLVSMKNSDHWNYHPEHRSREIRQNRASCRNPFYYVQISRRKAERDLRGIPRGCAVGVVAGLAHAFRAPGLAICAPPEAPHLRSLAFSDQLLDFIFKCAPPYGGVPRQNCR